MSSFNEDLNRYHDKEIAADKRASWIEVDFNEFQKRRFRRGSLKPEFQRAIKKWKYAHDKQAA